MDIRTARLEKEAHRTIERLLPRCDSFLQTVDEPDEFRNRVYQEFPRLFRLLYDLYGHQYDFFYHLEQLRSSERNSGWRCANICAALNSSCSR